jgi:hypothetical protein
MTPEQQKIFHIVMLLFVATALALATYHILTKSVLHIYDAAAPAGTIGNVGMELEALSLI